MSEENKDKILYIFFAARLESISRKMDEERRGLNKNEKHFKRLILVLIKIYTN